MKFGIAGAAGGLAIVALIQIGAESRATSAGFWFEPVTFDASEVEADRLGGGVMPPEMQIIQAVAMSEVQAAFAAFRLAVGGDRDARFRVRVLQTMTDPRFSRGIGPAGSSRGLWPLGGQGVVNFRLLASYAIAYAPPGSTRAEKIAAIGRGVGRAAAHELAHQILGSKDIHRTRDRRSFEYGNADRPEQYYGPMHWDVAGPMLADRLGTR